VTYYHKKSSPVPWIAALVLLGGFVGLVVYFTGDKEEPVDPFPPVVQEQWQPPSYEPEPQPVAPDPVPIEPIPQPRVAMTPAKAEKRLKEATLEWRAYAVKLCKEKQWESPRAVAFLEKVTWNDRDLEKQHANGLASIRVMLGTDSMDAVTLAEALAEKGDLEDFFEANWSKLDSGVAAKAKTEVVLDDMWKPNRIRWGFPLDTPIDKLQEFKHGRLALTQQAWNGLVVLYIQSLEVNDEAKMKLAQDAMGDGLRLREAKMRAGLRVLLKMPEASVKEVAEEFTSRFEGKEDAEMQAFLQTLVGEMAPAVEAAVAAKEESS
jgi:hypothetical protein